MKKKSLSLFISFLIFSFALIASVNAESTTIYNNYESATVSCGQDLVANIPALFPKVVSIVYTIIQVAVPILLVVLGSIDLVKGITAQKEDELKKGQQTFIKRLIAAALVFFVFIIVKLVISLAADGGGGRIVECAECFIKNECDKIGDLNGDGEITSEDIDLLEQYISNGIEKVNTAVTDINGDGIISTKDVIELKKKIGSS